MAKRPVPQYDFKAFGEAKRGKGEKKAAKRWRRNVYLSALLDSMSDTGIRIVTATAKEIAEVEQEK